MISPLSSTLCSCDVTLQRWQNWPQVTYFDAVQTPRVQHWFHTLKLNTFLSWNLGPSLVTFGRHVAQCVISGCKTNLHTCSSITWARRWALLTKSYQLTAKMQFWRPAFDQQVLKLLVDPRFLPVNLPGQAKLVWVQSGLVLQHRDYVKVKNLTLCANHAVARRSTSNQDPFVFISLSSLEIML